MGQGSGFLFLSCGKPWRSSKIYCRIPIEETSDLLLGQLLWIFPHQSASQGSIQSVLRCALLLLAKQTSWPILLGTVPCAYNIPPIPLNTGLRKICFKVQKNSECLPSLLLQKNLVTKGNCIELAQTFEVSATSLVFFSSSTTILMAHTALHQLAHLLIPLGKSEQETAHGWRKQCQLYRYQKEVTDRESRCLERTFKEGERLLWEVLTQIL